ncbi:amino acid adenylation domain-containing protein (plasmid) [Nostoc sp. NIES-3756]|uniref:non-ribosomal peptide synthetase n=1 Tax=Nostoc sp. NIES-3756 TaxID=1751286 RepID=UPI000720C769|nr:non-ribosomal peptide synthetase [Nostoc sp. NIES-3756]BAT56666.1 amino acid adenylation domain-containing protein [Nostoc sp. NIES-3756]
MNINNSRQFEDNIFHGNHIYKQSQILQIHQLFEAQVLQTPHHIAVELAGKRLSYQELNQCTNQLAYHLQILGIQPNAVVALCLERSLELIIAIIAILKAGGAYLPLDPSYPAERLNFMLEDSQASILLTQSHLCKSLPLQTTHRFCLDRDWQILTQYPIINPDNQVNPDHLAYAIYTSGSTGKPKGVAMPHRPLGNLINWQLQNSNLGSESRTLQYTPISFDVSFQEIFATLATGGTLVLIADETRRDPLKLLQYLNQAEIERLFLPFVALRQLAEVVQMEGIVPTKLREVITAGEQLRITDAIAHLFSQLPNCTLHNHYGPSETHVVTAFTMSGLPQDWPTLPPIGKAIANSNIYLLDSQLQPVPIGVPGELYVGGVSLAKGYLNRPDLTAERFIANPFTPYSNERLYKTGDLARYLPDGNIEYLGRTDQQVKIRGYRIEPGEVEATLETHPQIRQAVVIAREDVPGNKLLVAYVVLDSIEAETNFRQFLQTQLPEYMVPNAIIVLEKMPLTPSGKIDRQSLPAPEIKYDRGVAIAPRTPTEVTLAKIWAEVLSIEEIGINEDFLELGGHSLVATQVVSRIRQTFEISLPLSALFDAPTIAELAKLIEQTQEESRHQQIYPVDRSYNVPLALAQEPLWFLDQLAPNNPFYNVPQAFRLHGYINITALKLSFQEIINRHEILRTTFTTVDGKPVQVIHPSPDFQLSVDVEKADSVWELVIKEARRPFDLTRDLLIRANLFRLSETEHILLINLHHIVCDGWSFSIFLQELGTLYTAFASGQISPLPNLPIQYADFAVWHRQWLEGEIREQQLAYWQQQLKGLPPILPLPTDYPRPAVSSYQGARHFLNLSESLTQQLKELSRREGTTLFMTLLAALDTLLFHYTGQVDIAIGSLFANRHHPELENMLGFFTNTIVLRTDLSGLPSFRQLLQRVREVTLGAYTHQDLPFEELVRTLQPDRDLNQNSLVQVVFNLQNTPASPWQVPNLALTHLSLDNKTVKFDLFLELTETPTGLTGYFEYSTDLFTASTITRMADHLQKLLTQIVANPEQRISDISLLTTTELQLLHQWNQTQADFPKQCIHQLFEAQVELTPDAIAIEFVGQFLTYQQLNQRANQLAHYLQSLGVEPNVFVGICMERSPLMVIALLAILKAGGAYIPLDPAYPKERLAYMLNDSQVPILLTQQSLIEKLPEHSAQVIYLDTNQEIIARQSKKNPNSNIKPENLVYTLYTSGSTGKPKGVQILHSSLVNILNCLRQEIGIEQQDILFAVTTISFDIAAVELYLPLMVGARVVILSREITSDPSQLAKLVEQSNVTFMQATPATWQMLLAADWQGNSKLKILCGGEVLTRKLAQQLLERCACVWNVYGPTETTIWSTIHKVESGNGSVPIGRPVDNTQIYILKQHQGQEEKSFQLVPIGVPGELYIGGAGLTQGYLNRPELNQQRFIPNPFKPEDCLYKTGDLARYLPDGNIECLGRIDQQVKIRGFRIELGEIEAALSQHSRVRDTVVIAREDNRGEKCLVAYIVPKLNDLELTEDAAAQSQTQQVQQWQTIWNESYDQSPANGDPTFNIIAWNSSYTGLVIATEQMREWVDNTVERILSLQPQRVLEIGCGMGLLLFRIIPHCSYYFGMDISEIAIAYIEQQLKQNQQQNWSQVELAIKTASSLDSLEAEDYDTVILNSVIQYFPSVDYLVDVIEKAVKVVKPGGHIFIGDVRSLPLLEAFHTSVQLYQAPDSLTVEQLRQRIQKHIVQDSELVIDPSLFYALGQHLPQISRVQIQLKPGLYDNEMNRFRYDVILDIGTEVNLFEPECLEWQPELTIPVIHQILKDNQPKFLGLTRIKNARIAADVEAVKLLANNQHLATVGELKTTIQENIQQIGINPQDFCKLSESLPYKLYITWSDAGEDGYYDVIFQSDKSVVPSFAKVYQDKPWKSYANNPVSQEEKVNLIPQLRTFLKEKLPEYMIPTAFVLMDSLPLTPNRKVNRQALPAPNQLRPELQKEFIAPSTPIEKQLAEIWTQLLGLDQVGVHDNFFELGGHSLLLAQMLVQVQKTFQVKLSLQNIFMAPTVADLTKFIILQAEGNTNSSIHPILNLEAEAVLDSTIHSRNLPFASISEPENVFLTGVTGFLGAYLLYELLSQTQANIYCLVRAKNNYEGYLRIQNNLKNYELWNENQSNRIIPVIGDLARPFLDIPQTEFQNLSAKIDAIYHNGGLVNLLYPYSALKAANVLGTQEVLRLATQTKLKWVHFVSTIGVFSPPAYPEVPVILEQEAERTQGLYGYTQSKWVAEKLINIAHERGIPTAIYRPTWIEGHSQTGICNQPGFLRSLIKGCIQLGLAPDWNMPVDIVPVDYTSRAIAHLSRQKSLSNRIFHISNPHSISWQQLVTWMQDFGYSIQIVPLEDWLSKVLFLVPSNPENALYPFLSFLSEKVLDEQKTIPELYFQSQNLIFGVQNTLNGLAGTNITCPPVNNKLLKTYFSYFINNGFLDTPY